MKDYYAVLGLPRSAGPDSINAAKRRLSHLYHQDTRAKDMDPVFAEERIREINEAWEVLADPERRADYDRATAATETADSSAGVPLLSVSPPEIELVDVAPKGIARFSVQVAQVGGPKYDPMLHELEIRWGAPWNRAELRYDAGGSTALPLTLTFELDLGTGEFEPDTDYVGDFILNAVRR